MFRTQSNRLIDRPLPPITFPSQSTFSLFTEADLPSASSIQCHIFSSKTLTRFYSGVRLSSPTIKAHHATELANVSLSAFVQGAGKAVLAVKRRAFCSLSSEGKAVSYRINENVNNHINKIKLHFFNIKFEPQKRPTLYSLTVLDCPYPANQHKPHRMDNFLSGVNAHSHKEQPLLLILPQNRRTGYQNMPSERRYRSTVNIDGRTHRCADLIFAHSCLAGEVNAA